jgi:hypothetical protein
MCVIDVRVKADLMVWARPAIAVIESAWIH